MEKIFKLGRKETKASPADEHSPNSLENEFDFVSHDSIEKAMLINDSSSPALDENHQGQINSSKLSLNRFKDQLTQRARNVMTKAPSLGSLLTNSSPTLPNSDSIYFTEVLIERGEDLAVKDLNGTSDPYVKIVYDNEDKYTTSIITKSLNPVWNERCPIFMEDLETPLYFYVYDSDRIGKDERMGMARLDLSRIPLDKSYSAWLELENEFRSDGKRGILKVSVTITLKTREFCDEVLRNFAKQLQIRNINRSGSTVAIGTARRTIDIFIIEGRNLIPLGVNKLCSPFVRLKYGTNKKYRTQTVKSTNNPVWHQPFMYDTNAIEFYPLELTVYDDTNGSGELIGRGICNLNHLDEECTHRIVVNLEDGTGVIEMFVTITVTTASQEVVNDGDSSLQAPLESIPSKLTNEDFERYKLSSTFKTLNPIRDIGKLEIKIYQARDLSAKDITGKSDPFCIVELDSNRLRTHTIYKTLNPIWNKSFVIPVQDIHSILELTVYDEDANKSYEFIGKVAIPLLAIKNGEKKWLTLKDRKCLLPTKGAIEIEATLIYTNLKAVLRTFNPRQTAYYQTDGKFSVGAIKQHVSRIQNMLKGVVNLGKFINYCFQWENPILSFFAFIASLIIVWNFELYMLPYALLLLFARNAVVEYRRGRLGKSFATLGDETISAVIVQPAPIDEEVLDGDTNSKEQKKSFMGMIQSIQDTVLEIQGYIDAVASTLERIKNLFNFTVPWLSTLLIIILFLVAILLYYVPLRYLILAFIINKFTKCFRKPKGYIDNNEIADFLSRLPSDTELMQYRELKVLTRVPTQKKLKTTK